jgi:hypothetical protein
LRGQHRFSPTLGASIPVSRLTASPEKRRSTERSDATLAKMRLSGPPRKAREAASQTSRNTCRTEAYFLTLLDI